ncbi:MAG: hypothetical protein LUF35_08065 [Lachnospiraceae bacterium]|nr:hypothetical protein [Lachnospiraceae bacterium]
MNPYYSYPDISLWQLESWNKKINPLFGLIRTLGELPEDRRGVDQLPAYQRDPEEVKVLPGYQYKSGSYDDPSVVEQWAKRGMQVYSREGGTMRSVVFTPADAAPGSLPLLVIFHRESYEDPFWALKTLDIFKEDCSLAAEKKSYAIWFIVTNNMPDLRRSYCGMLRYDMTDEIDTERIYLDVRLLLAHGQKLSSLEDFRYILDDGTVAPNPDDCMEEFEGYPVLKISNRISEHITPTFTSMTTEGQQDGTIDFDATYHSETGKRMMEAIRIEYDYDDFMDPGVQAIIRDLGLECECGETEGSPWALLLPKCAMEKDGKELPLLAVFCGKQAMITSLTFYYQYVKIAAQGECAVLFLSGATLPENDVPHQIICQVLAGYPVDPARLYVSGHSHWGHIAQLYMRKYPHMVAAAAPLGNTPGIPLPEGSGEVILVSDEDIEKISQVDMPLAIVSGCCEAGCMFPVNQQAKGFDPGINVEGYAASVEGRAEAWNRRLRSANCPPQTLEEIKAAADSPNKAVRELGIPADYAQTLLLDGFEHYIGDFKNRDGKYHLRIVGAQNMPHMATPAELDLAWSFLRRFARDLVTGETIELI